MTHDINTLSRKATLVIDSCKNCGQLANAINYIDRICDFITTEGLMAKRDLEIFAANLRGRAKLKHHQING